MLPLTTCEALANLIDHPLVAPELTDEQVIEGLELAKRYHIACASVRPCDIDLAVRTLQGSSVKAGAVCGFPHGSANTATKLYEARDLLRRGASEIDMVIAISKLLSREFQYVQMELLQMSELCHKEGALLKVILENAYLTDELKIIACRCCERAEVDFVKTSTGFAPSGYTLADIALMRRHLPEEIGVKAAGGIRTLDQVLEVYQAGCTRIGTTSTAALLDEGKARLTAQAQSEPRPEGSVCRHAYDLTLPDGRGSDQSDPLEIRYRTPETAYLSRAEPLRTRVILKVLTIQWRRPGRSPAYASRWACQTFQHCWSTPAAKPRPARFFLNSAWIT